MSILKELMLFIFLLATVFGGAFAVLVVLYYMENINPAFVISALGAYIYTVFVAMWVGLRWLS